MKPKLKPKPTYLLGDHHAAHDDLLRVLLRKGLRHARLIHVGDGEEGYPDAWADDTAERLDSAFAALDLEYLSIRGNHSNPAVFNGTVMLPNFKLLPDYSRMEIDGQTWLFVGGAVSINRLDRAPRKTWWPDEPMVLREDLAGRADVLVTHSGPTWMAPPSNPLVEYYISCEQAMGCDTLRQELRNEQRRHDRLFQLVRPQRWYFGHYHASRTRVHAGCTVRQLDCAELVRHPPPEP
jgi:hypothetical protein